MKKAVTLTLFCVALIIPLLLLLFTDQQVVPTTEQQTATTVKLNDDAVEKPVKEASQKKSEQQEKKEEITSVENQQEVVKKEPKKKDTRPIVVINAHYQKEANTTMEKQHPSKGGQALKMPAAPKGVQTKQNGATVTLYAAKNLKKEFEQKGYRVMLTRTKNEVDLSSQQRAKKANQQKPIYFINVQAAASQSMYERGFAVFLPSYPQNEKLFEDNKKLANTILNSVRQQDVINGKGLYFRKDLTVLNYAKVPTVMIQLGYLSNAKDDVKLANKKYVAQLSKWIVKDIEKAQKQ